MKYCFACETRFDSSGWRCPSCDIESRDVQGFLQIPVSQDTADAFPADAHDALDLQQEHSFWFRQRKALIVDLLDRYAHQAQSLLEAGCGTGFVLAGIGAARPGMRLAGGEVFLSGLRAARRRTGPDTLLMQMDARRIPFRDEFDVIAAFDVLEHITDDRTAMAEMLRAVKPGGIALVSVPQHPWLWSRADEIARHQRRYRRRELADKMRDTGFEVLFQTSFVSLLLPAFVIQRLFEGVRGTARQATGLNPPQLLDAILGAILAGERLLIRLGLRLPLGSSRFLVARRPAA